LVLDFDDVPRGTRRRLQPFDRLLDTQPNDLPLAVAAFQHEISEPSGFGRRVGAMTFDHQIGRPVDVELGVTLSMPMSVDPIN
jgi:hypothetical protein